MGGAYVFPGGRLDDADATIDERLVDGIEAVTARFADLDRRSALAHYVAAFRELFEEAGVLMARDATGRVPPMTETARRNRLAAARRAVHRRDRSLADVLEEEGLRLAADALVAFAHWTTPEREGTRFDTRFFLAGIPDEQAPLHDEAETIESLWTAPADALARHRENEIVLPPPTWCTLKDLARVRTVDEALAWAADQPLARIQPRILPDGVTMVLPGDRLFPPSSPHEVTNETRFVLEGKSWKATSIGSSGD